MNRRLLVGCVWLLSLGFLQAEPPKPKFKVGKETTFFTEPLDKDGYLDYEAALNERLRGQTTPETNALVVLLQAMGPKPEGRELPADFYKALGTPPPPEKGDYLVPLPIYLEQQEKGRPDEELYELRQKLRQQIWKATDHPEIAAWLKANEKPLELATQASRRADYFYPRIARNAMGERDFLLGTSLSAVQPSRSIAEMLTIRANLALAQNRPDEAWADLLTVHRLGRLVARGGTLIELLVGVAIDSIASDADVLYLQHAKLTAQEILKRQQELRELPPMPTIASIFALSERATFLDSVQMMRKMGFQKLSMVAGNAPPKKEDPELAAKQQAALEAIDWETIFQIGNSWYDRLAEAASSPNIRERFAAYTKIEDDIRDQQRKMNRSDLREVLEQGNLKKITKKISENIGLVLIGLMLPASNRVSVAAIRCEQTQQNLQVAFALAAYRADQGKYPAKLEELSPKYLAKIPKDLFTDKPLIYKLSETGYLLSSRGENGQDDGGKTRTDTPPGDDISVRMPIGGK